MSLISERELRKVGEELAAAIETATRFHVIAKDIYGFGYTLILTDVQTSETYKVEVRQPL